MEGATPVALVNNTLIVSPGPPSGVADKVRETGVSTKPLPRGPVTVPNRVTPIESGLSGLRASSCTVVSVSVRAPWLPVHERTTSGESGDVPVPDPKMMLVAGGEGAKTETVSKAANPDSSPVP